MKTFSLAIYIALYIYIYGFNKCLKYIKEIVPKLLLTSFFGNYFQNVMPISYKSTLKFLQICLVFSK